MKGDEGSGRIWWFLGLEEVTAFYHLPVRKLENVFEQRKPFGKDKINSMPLNPIVTTSGWIMRVYN